MKQRLLFFTLISGLILSSMVRISFNINDGFVVNDYLMRLIPLPIFDIARVDSDQLFLTSTILGYLFYSIYCLISLDKISVKHKGILFNYLIILIGTLIASYFEIVAITKDYQGSFTGNHFRIGPSLFLIGIILFIQLRRQNLITN